MSKIHFTESEFKNGSGSVYAVQATRGPKTGHVFLQVDQNLVGALAEVLGIKRSKEASVREQLEEFGIGTVTSRGFEMIRLDDLLSSKLIAKRPYNAIVSAVEAEDAAEEEEAPAPKRTVTRARRQVTQQRASRRERFPDIDVAEVQKAMRVLSRAVKSLAS